MKKNHLVPTSTAEAFRIVLFPKQMMLPRYSGRLQKPRSAPAALQSCLASGGEAGEWKESVSGLRTTSVRPRGIYRLLQRCR